MPGTTRNPAPDAETPRPRALRRAHAFGLDIELSFGAPGLPSGAGPASGRRTRIDLASEADINRAWSTDGSTRVLEERAEEDESPARTIDFHPQTGYLLYARGFGLARISPTGAQIACAPPTTDPWNWQRFLVGRILPWAAVLRGCEAMHASAVAIDDRVVAFVGPTGTGKTSLALRLVAHGATFVTDDVLVLDTDGSIPRAWPGAGIASVRPAERAAMGSEAWDRVGTVLGVSGKSYVSLPRTERALPLGALYLLSFDDGPAIERLVGPDPRLLLGSTFVVGVQSPTRLRYQLDIYATVARRVPMFRLRIHPGIDAGSLADRVTEHLAAISLGPLPGPTP